MATAVDIISYLNPAPETNVPKHNNEASDNFEKVFSEVSKNYSDDNSPKNTDNNVRNTPDSNQNQTKADNQNQNISNENQKVDNKKDNNEIKTQKPEEKNSQEKVDAKNSDEQNSQPKLSSDEKEDNAEAPVIQNSNEQNNVLEQINAQVSTQISPVIDTVVETAAISVLPARAEINTQSEKLQEQPPQVQLKNPVANVQVTNNIQNRNTIQANQINQQNENVQKKSDSTQAVVINTNTTQIEQPNNTVQEETVLQTPIVNQATNQVTVKNGTVQLVPQENTNQIVENTQSVPVQKEAKDLIQQATIQESSLPKGQMIDLVKASTIKELAQQDSTPQENIASSAIFQEIQETETETPVIATNLATANKIAVNQNNSENKTNEIDVKNPLTQEIIDKTNAKVVNVETSGSKSSNSDLLSKQSPQEQLVKLSLNTESKTENQNTILSNISDTNMQVSFDKALNSVQNQAPKELSKTDILSQIHNQLDKLGQEEGTTKVTIILKPENLGRIQLELVNSKEGMSAKMTTDNAQVKQLLDKNLDSLKDTIGSQGVTLGNVSVKLENTQNQQNEQFAYDEHQGKNNQQQSNNPQKKDEDEQKFANEMNSRISTENEEETSYNSEINYKV